MTYDERARRITERYSSDAAAYRELWAPVLEKPGARLLAHLGDKEAARVLDIGTGVGSLFPSLRESFPQARILGVDGTFGMIRLGPADLPRAVMDAESLAIGDERIDVAIFAFILFHLSQPLEGLREAGRVLRSGGSVGTVTWGGEMESSATRIWDEEMDALGPPPAELDLAQHELVDSGEKVQSLILRAGFQDARGWAEEYEHQIDLSHLLRLRTSVGRHKRRFEMLDASARATCLARIRARLSGCGPEAFLTRGTIVYGIGHKP